MHHLKHYHILVIVVSFIALCALFVFQLTERTPNAQPSSEEPFARITLPGGEVIHADIADTAAKRKQGLSGRVSMPEDQGLLFLHRSRGTHGYWMKDMRFPIDIIWIDGDRIVDISHSLSPESAPLTVYRPAHPADRVLELNSGVAQASNLETGQRLDISLFGL